MPTRRHRVTCPHCSRTFTPPATLQSRGGKARAAKLTPERASEIARAAVQARWAKVRAERESSSG